MNGILDDAIASRAIIPACSKAMAYSSGVRPSSLRRRVSAPASSSSLAIFSIFSSAAPSTKCTIKCKAVLPRLNVALGSAPASSKIFGISYMSSI